MTTTTLREPEDQRFELLRSVLPLGCPLLGLGFPPAVVSRTDSFVSPFVVVGNSIVGGSGPVVVDTLVPVPELKIQAGRGSPKKNPDNTTSLVDRGMVAPPRFQDKALIHIQLVE